MIVKQLKKRFIFNVNLNFLIDNIETNTGKYKTNFIKEKLKDKK